MIYAGQVLIMNSCVFTRQDWWGFRQVFHQSCSLADLAGREWPVGQPPEKRDAYTDADETIEKEHPLEADQTLEAVHLLETGGDEADHGSGDLRRCEVHANSLSSPRWWIEERQVVSHAWPHASDDNAQEQAEETG